MTFSFLIVEYSGKSSQAEKKKRRAQKMEEDAESSDYEEPEAEIVEKANDAIQSMAIDKQVGPLRLLIIKGPGTHNNWRHS